MKMRKWLKVLAGGVGVLAALFLVFVAFLWFMFAPENWNKRKIRFQKAAEKGIIVVHAINRYQEDFGMPPPSIEALVPAYLEQVPNTGLSDYPNYEYQMFTNSKSSLVWYDLGSRKGKPMDGLWVYIDGDSDHAILALTLDQNDCVVNARVDRMPKEYQEIEFDMERWKKGDSRIEMARSLSKHVALKDMPLSEVKELLGEPSGTRILRNSPWELRIECSKGVLNWDVFFYWPTQEYPKHIYGGNTERIGRWAYVHE